MEFSRLIQDLGLSLAAGNGRVELLDLTDDSRRVTEGCLFLARDTGDDRWKTFARDAVERGAVALVVPEAIAAPPAVAVASGGASVKIDQAMASRLSARFFDEPARCLKLIGVTGTNGKTTVATLTQYLLNSEGVKCGLIGTVAIDHGSPDGPLTAELTTPGAIDLHRHFAEIVKHGCEACAMEVSSHALDQGRVDGLEFEVAVFTNLTQDHLDYHGTMENYAAAKAKLFAGLSEDATAIINGGDSVAEVMWPSKAKVIVTQVINSDLSKDGDEYKHGSATRAKADGNWLAFIQELRPTSSLIALVTSGIISEAKFTSDPDFELPVVGEHNVCNAIQAIAASRCIHPIKFETLLECPVVPGRLEPVKQEGVDTPAILVDYAHTPDALVNVLKALQPLTQEGGKLVVVFGCGGDRDRTKRPLMAQAACGLADVAVLTSDNPRTEDPQQILDDAIVGVPAEAKDKLVVEIDRAKAIESAILSATANDTVLIAGKGHEDYQILGTEKIHFDDREQAAAALAKWVEQHD